MKRAEKDYKYEFLPSNLEIIERPPSPLGGLIIYIILAALIILLILSLVFKIDVVISTTGSLEPQEGLKVVNTNMSKKITKLNKVEGDTVKKGETILELENNSQAKYDKALKDIEVLKLEEKISLTKVNNMKDNTIFQNTKVEAVRVEELQLDYAYFWETLALEERDYQKSIDRVNKQLSKKDITKEEKEMYLETKANTISNRKRKIKQDELSNVKNHNSNLDAIKEQEEVIKELKEIIEKDKIVSPVDGEITVMNYKTVDSFVNPSIDVATILPSQSTYIIKSKIENRYVSKIKEGMEVFVKIDAYDYQIFGGIDGKIKSIATNATLSEDKQRLDYDIEIEIPTKRNEKMQLKPGMNVSIDIKTDKKRVFDFILEPVRKTVDDAF